MGKIKNRLIEQLESEYKKDAENCIKIYDKLMEVNDGHVWESQWSMLVNVTFLGFPNNKRRYKPTQVGYIFLNGINTTTFPTNSSIH